MFYLIDKPRGISSFDAIRKLRKVLGIKKMGHAGTLDPLATGALLVATENSTKLLPLLESARKEYICTIRLDGTTDSWDLGTPVIYHDMSDKIEHTKEALARFLLEQKTQKTPKYSALHIDGVRAYALAREGVDFETPTRPITVYKTEIIEMLHDAITLQIEISSGGYIRSFAPLIGAFFGLPGGYISSLRRTHIHHAYGTLDSIHASELERPIPISYDLLFPSIPVREIGADIYQDLSVGKSIPAGLLGEGHRDMMAFFLYKETGYMSLVSYENGTYTIIKNNVG